jgi:hypothetical protein
MNKTDILALPANRETDMLVALAIGWQVDEATATSPTGSRNSRHKGDDGWLEWYTSDMNAAYQAAEWLNKTYRCNISFGIMQRVMLTQGDVKYVCSINSGTLAYDTPSCSLLVFADSVPLAICQVVLLAVNSQP